MTFRAEGERAEHGLFKRAFPIMQHQGRLRHNANRPESLCLLSQPVKKASGQPSGSQLVPGRTITLRSKDREIHALLGQQRQNLPQSGELRHQLRIGK